jgi:hypothetical protein
MNTPQQNQWEARLQTLAGRLPYPPTPDLTAAVAQQLGQRRARRPSLLRPVWVTLLALALLCAAALALSPVRAAVLEWLQIGAVRIWLVEPPTPIPAPTVPMPTQSVVSAPLSSVLDLAGETTLTAAQEQVNFLIQLPMLPTDLAEPDHVYLQQAEGDLVILVWLWPEQPDQVRMSLHLLGPGAFLWKMQPPDVVEVQVKGAPAFWTQGPYYIKVGAGESWGSVRLVDGHVLVWTDGAMTYRLEGDFSLAEAIAIAESLGQAE